MRAAIKYVCCLTMLVSTLRSQTSSPTAQELIDKGKLLYTQQGPKAAMTEFEDALKLFRASSDRHGEAVSLGYLANCYRKLEELDKALDFANQALRLKNELGDRGEVGNTQNQLGLIYWEKADYPPAIGHLEEAIKIASAVGDKELEGAARNNLGLVFDERGDYKHSLEQYQHALDLHRQSHFERGEGDTLGNIGGVYLLLGKFREALPYYQQALQISERLGLKPASSEDLGNIGICLAGSGDIDGALASFDRALKIAREAGLPKEEADWHKGKATTMVDVGRYDSALDEYTTAENVYEHAGLQRELVEALNDTGGLYELLGDGITAEGRFERALQLATKIGNGFGERVSHLALGDLERRRKKHDSAEIHFAQALASARAVGDEGAIVTALLQRSTNEIGRNRFDVALQSASEASLVAEQSGNRPAMARARFALGEARRSRTELQQALDEYSAAETLQNQLRDPELGWRIRYGQGKSLEALTRSDDAIAAYRAAVRIIEETRADITEERYRAGYMEDRYQAYVALVEIFLKLRKPDEAFVYSEKLRARAYLDQLGVGIRFENDSEAQQRMDLEERIRSLRSRLRKEFARSETERSRPALEAYSTELEQAEKDYQGLLDSSRTNRTDGRVKTIPTPADIQRLLPSGSALIEYVIGKQAISTLLMTRSFIIGMPILIPSESLSSRVELLRDLITERKPEWVQPAQGLSRLLLDPLQTAGYLNGVHQLLIIPDGILNYVPFAALPTDKDRFLSDQFIVTYLPSAVVLMKPDSGPGNGRSLLAMAPSNAHLLNAAVEVRSIGRMFSPKARVVAGKAATETLFKQVAGNYDYLHLATHSNLNRNAPVLSALEFEPDGENDGRLELHEIVGMKLHARLVTLSACETALGGGYFSEIPAGDEFVGMTQAFLSAGGRNVLASLWAVNDESTKVLMSSFYLHLSPGGGAKALAQAQQEVRRSDPRFRHPYYWAGFVMVGPIN
jgi:CHAT domain-containing protein/Tfp pilus assembly protein PilF